MMKAKAKSPLKRSLFWGSIASLTAAATACTTGQADEVRESKRSPDNAVAPGNEIKHYEEEQPNILYIVLDDVGFSSLGSYGSEIETPNMDRLAENGLRYNRFNVTPTSSPTRASLLTSRNSAAVGMAAVSAFDLGPEIPAYQGEITDAAATTAEVLKDEGYNTFMIGKWHLTPHNSDGPMGPFESWPLGKGFERFYGFLPGETDQFNPILVVDNHHMDHNPAEGREDYHLSEDLVDQTIQLIKDQKSLTPKRPFFAYLSFGATHAPHQPPAEYMEKYEGKYDSGWDEIRRRRFEKQKELGIIPADAELAPLNPRVEAWDSLSDDQKRVYARFQEAYAGFLDHTDAQIGRLMEFLTAIDQMDNTIIVLLADNGASQEGGIHGNINILKGFNFVPTTTEEILPRIDEIGSETTSVNYPLGWAQTANTPFPFYKQNTFLGGIRSPLIIHWPDGLADKGEIRGQFHHVEDISVTMYDILGINTPDEYRGAEQLPVDGVSMVYTFDDAEAPSRRPTQFFSMSTNRGILHDGWMASVIHKKGGAFDEDPWMLFNLNEDFSQTENLAEQHPEKLTELRKLWMEKAKEYNVLPVLEQTFELFAFTSPDDRYKNRTIFEYYQGTSHLANGVVAPIAGKKHTITAPLNRESGDEEGILLAQGDHDAGYVFYIMDSKLIYEYNFFGRIFRVVSDTEVPAGESTVQVTVVPKEEVKSKADLFPATAALFIDGKQVGEGPIMALPFRHSHEGLTIGADKHGKVSTAYKDRGEFPFTGTFEKITVEIDDIQNKLDNFIPYMLEERERQMQMDQL